MASLPRRRAGHLQLLQSIPCKSTCSGTLQAYRMGDVLCGGHTSSSTSERGIGAAVTEEAANNMVTRRPAGPACGVLCALACTVILACINTWSAHNSEWSSSHLAGQEQRRNRCGRPTCSGCCSGWSPAASCGTLRAHACLQPTQGPTPAQQTQFCPITGCVCARQAPGPNEEATMNTAS